MNEVDTGPAQRAPSYYTATLNEDTDYPTLQGHGAGRRGDHRRRLHRRRHRRRTGRARPEGRHRRDHKIGWGASGRNGGQVTGSLSGDERHAQADAPHLGADVDDFIWHLRWRGHQIIQQRVAKYGIACDLKHGHLHAAYKPATWTNCAPYEEAVRRGMGDEVSLLDRARCATCCKATSTTARSRTPATCTCTRSTCASAKPARPKAWAR
jgi:hypothetical protein